MITKAKKFKEFLEENRIKCFLEENINDDFKTTVFRSYMEIEGQNIPVVIILDSSIYSIVRIMIIPKVLSKHSKNEILDYINELNRKYKVFKYYITQEGDLCLDSCLPSSQENFNPETIYTIIDVILKHLKEEYPIFMKKIWAN